MRELQSFLRRCVAFRRHAGASVLLTSLLALFLSQPFHAAAPLGSANLATAAGSAVSVQQPTHGAPHDADLCSVCRATAQTRLGLRVALRLGEVSAEGPCLTLHLPAPAPARASPPLRATQPRAPPSTLLVLEA